MKGTNEFKQVIGAYLDERARADAQFALAYAKQGKSLDECCNYIFSEVQRSGMNGFADEEVFGMAVHYYDEDNVGEITQVADGQVVCPHCGRKLEVERTRRLGCKYGAYFTTITTCHEFQVLRHWEIDCVERKGTPRSYVITEIVQMWVGCDGKTTIVARSLTAFGGCFLLTSPLTIKREHIHQYTPYNIWSDVCPYGRVLPILRRNGFSPQLVRRKIASPCNLMKALLRSDFVETLVKTQQWKLLKLQLSSGRVEKFRHAVNICHRNGYEVEDAAMWVDYLQLLEDFHFDTHNARYVCPADLHAEHDRLLLRKQRKEEEERRQQYESEIHKYECAYRRDKGRYFGICFGNEHITITAIGGVREMAEEGITMHHCVYSMKYFAKKNSLILSAKSREGLRLETVEVNLASLSVVQSRGRYNSKTEYHDEIVALVMANMGMINKAKRQRLRR